MRGMGAFAVAVCAALLACSSAWAAFPYKAQLPPGPNQGPNDLTGTKVEWMYSATPEAGNLEVNLNPMELGGVRGAHLADNADVDQAWRTTTGRPDVTISVLDSGIKWNDAGAMRDLRLKTRLSRGELPVPRHDRAASLEPGQDCSRFRAADDANGDGVVNLVDFSCDSRVQRDPAARGGKGVGPADVLDPQDVLIAFSDGRDDDGNGYRDDIVGWDFLDDDNDPFDDVQYGHGTGEAIDSVAEADNREGGEGRNLGTCPNCMAIHLRVGDSFIADVNDFAQAVVYSVDNDVEVVQEALGTLNHSRFGRDAVEYAYDNGVTIIASAADEAAQHHNWPSSYPHVIVVNSVTKYDEELTPGPRSYLQFNGCTNFSSKISVAIPSVSCSSDATGRASGMAGLIYSAAYDARDAGRLRAHPSCRRVGGRRCYVTPNEVRQLMASGQVGGKPLADDVNFAFQPERSCTPPTPTCSDPYLGAPGNHAVVSPLAQTRRYPARKGHDQFYGWGRVNMNSAVDAVDAGRVPPEVEIESPEWFTQIDPARARIDVRGTVAARGAPFACRVYVAPGSYPNNASTQEQPPGDFKPVSSAACDGSARSRSVSGVIGSIDVAELKRRFPPQAGDFRGPEPGNDVQRYNGRPNLDTYGFTIKVVATSRGGRPALSGEDRRNGYLHRDRDLLRGFPRFLGTDGASSPLWVDLDRDNRDELVLGTSDGVVHAFKPNGREAPGWPVRGAALPLHTGGRAFRSGEVRPASGAILASVAAADLDRDGSPEVVAADYEGRVYAWSARGRPVWGARTRVDWSGKPLAPFVDVRKGKRHRTQRGFIASPVLADIDGNDGGRLEVVAASMDRHVYAWNHDGRRVRGFPVIVVDPAKVASVDPRTQRVTFNANAGEELNQGAIIDTPAVGDITGDGKPEIVVGTNEEYAADAPGEGGINAATSNTASIAILEQTGALAYGNSRLYAIRGTGRVGGGSPYLPGWPFKVGKIFTELLPVVGEGITGAPVIGPVDCPSGGRGAKVGVMPDAGVSYVVNPNATSCYGEEGGKSRGLQTDVTLSGRKQDAFAYSAVGHPAFGRFAGGISYLAPATGIFRALDLAVNEYQGGQDYLGAWDAATGQFRPGFPGVVNDLQFLTGPSVGDVDGRAGEEMLGGTAYLDVHAFTGSGGEVAGWPKLTSDWMVANPALGTFGVPGDAASARKSVAVVTRSGFLFVYRVEARGCADASWPRFHHDNANSGDFARDAVAPGRATSVRRSGGRLSFVAPGDDGMCGTAARYEVVQSDRRLSGRSFARGAVAVGRPVEAGSRVSVDVPGVRRRNLALRAVDEQGNAGPAVVVGQGAGALRVSVSPRRARVGRRTAFRVRVRSSSGAAVRGATVKLAGARGRTDGRGRAVLRVALRRVGRSWVTATRAGARGRAAVRGTRAPGFTGKVVSGDGASSGGTGADGLRRGAGRR